MNWKEKTFRDQEHRKKEVKAIKTSNKDLIKCKELAQRYL
jgi:hypothetical protein